MERFSTLMLVVKVGRFKSYKDGVGNRLSGVGCLMPVIVSKWVGCFISDGFKVLRGKFFGEYVND